jgi:flagellar secretion chaperone FliS
MNGYGQRDAVHRYQQLGVQAEIGEASPHRLVAMLLEGALTRVVAARGAMEAGETARKGELIGRAIGLIEGLKVSLDHQRGGEIATNLAALYDYAGQRLLQASATNDPAMLTEVVALLREISSGWAAITPPGGLDADG